MCVWVTEHLLDLLVPCKPLQCALHGCPTEAHVAVEQDEAATRGSQVAVPAQFHVTTEHVSLSPELDAASLVEGEPSLLMGKGDLRGHRLVDRRLLHPRDDDGHDVRLGGVLEDVLLQEELFHLLPEREGGETFSHHVEVCIHLALGPRKWDPKNLDQAELGATWSRHRLKGVDRSVVEHPEVGVRPFRMLAPQFLSFLDGALEFFPLPPRQSHSSSEGG